MPTGTTTPTGVAAGLAMVARAGWAARAFAGYDAAAVQRVVAAAAAAGAAEAERLARDEVAETGAGVVGDRVLRNLASSTGLAAAFARQDHVSPRPGPAVLLLPRPVGVVLAVAGPASEVFAVVLAALLTRNAVVLCPGPAAGSASGRAAGVMAAAAVAAGAPDGCVQWADRPDPDLLDALRADPRTPLVLDRAAGSVPVLVTADADLAAAARCIVASKSFDASLPAGTESVLVVERSARAELLGQLAEHGAHLLRPEQCERLRSAMFPQGRFDPGYLGQDARTVARRAGVRVPARTRVLLAPFDLPVPEEVLAQPLPCPVLGLVEAPNVARGTELARAVLRVGGGRHAAVVHSGDPRTVLELAAALSVDRLTVNDGANPAAYWVDPARLVEHTTLAWAAAPAAGRAAAAGRTPRPPAGRRPRLTDASAPGPAAVPGYPYPSNDPRYGGAGG